MISLVVPPVRIQCESSYAITFRNAPCQTPDRNDFRELAE
jgi:hypothetical protein